MNFLPVFQTVRRFLGDLPAAIDDISIDENFRGIMHYVAMSKLEQTSDPEEREKMASQFNRIMRIMDSFAYSEQYREKVFSAFADVLGGIDELVTRIKETPEKMDHDVDPAKDPNIQ